MSNESTGRLSRRVFLAAGAAAGGVLAAPAVWAQSAMTNSTEPDNAVREIAQRNIMSFTTRRWRDHFSSLRGGAILCDTQSRCVHFWSADQSIYRIYPSSVPMTEEMTRRGRTRVVQKVVGPSWSPTPNMRRRNPEWPPYVPPGPDNPLGTHALYLSWQYYRVHGTNDTRKIGRRSSNGCIGLYNNHIQELFSYARVGTQVLLI
jgi:L,D-transpeptidase ErfK/SrfK